jgi:hypothetical protein
MVYMMCTFSFISCHNSFIDKLDAKYMQVISVKVLAVHAQRKELFSLCSPRYRYCSAMMFIVI